MRLLLLPVVAMAMAMTAPAQSIDSRHVLAMVIDGGYTSFVMPGMTVFTTSDPSLLPGGMIDLGGYTEHSMNGGSNGVWILPAIREPRPDWETTWVDRSGTVHQVATYLTDRERRDNRLIVAAAERHQFQVMTLQRYFPPRPPNTQ